MSPVETLLAEVACRADDSMYHHERTDDFPCAACRSLAAEQAKALRAAGLLAGCDCTELCEMGPTCPGGMAAGLPGSGCWRTDPPPPSSDLVGGAR